MATIFSSLGISDNERVFAGTIGQEVIYRLVAEYVNRNNMAFQEAASAFVGGMTDRHAFRFKTPGSSRMQARALGTRPAVRKVTGSYDVALPLWDKADAIAVDDDVSMAYMTAQDFDIHLRSVTTADVNTRRYELLKAIFNNSNYTFADPIYGNLTIRRLANGDGTTYLPVLGSETGAEDTHHLESGYAETAISDTNNPFTTCVQELVEHFGENIGGENIVAFIPTTAVDEVEVLTDFVQVEDRFIRSGADADVPERLPTVPGTIIGRMSGALNACWVSHWRWVPSNYMIFLHLEEIAPIMERVDEADTNLPRGLALIANDGVSPVEQWYWRDRFGYAVVNRLNGVVMEMGTGGTYTVPTAYQ